MSNEIYDELDELPARPRKEIPAADFELLVLAARALNADFEEVDGEGYGNLHFPDGSTAFAWNPLVHSDDALNLCADLNIELRYHLAGDAPAVTATCAGDGRVPVLREPWGDDKKAATRRVIVRAAAESIRFLKFMNDIS